MIAKDLLLQTSARFLVSPNELLSPIRTDRIARARMAAMVTLYDLGFSLVEVGLFFGGRDHTTVIYARRRLPVLCAQDKLFADRVQALREAFALPPLVPRISSQLSVKTPVLP